MSKQNEKTIQDLKLEVQELRQFMIALVNPFTGIARGSQGLPHKLADEIYDKLTGYQPVEVNEKAMDCCEGGPQWGHSYGCPLLP